MADHHRWHEIRPSGIEGDEAYRDEMRVSEFRELVFGVRVGAGLTQAELAERMGTTQSVIARLEAGGTRPSMRTLEKLAAAVGHRLTVTIGPVDRPGGATVSIG